MSVRRLLLIACSAAALSAGPGGAQSLRNLPVPAEFPPPTYKGTQYVDSAGCVFIRAGVGAGETWVPRLTRARQPLCGFVPSLASASPTKPQAQQEERRAAATDPQPTPRSAASPVPVKPAAAPRSPQRVTATTTAKPASAPKAISKPKTDVRTACAGLDSASAAYIVRYNGIVVRCGPQEAHHVSYARGSDTRAIAAAPRPGTPAMPETVPPGTRVAPARIYARQQTSLAGIRVPEGMKPVWEDDRLNPRRAHQTFEGKARMELMWTNTVPRRLIDRNTGAEVVARGAATSDPMMVTQTRRTVQSSAQRAAVSTRSAPPAPAAEATRQTAHYAQAGLFTDAAQGHAAAQRILGSGLPARHGKLQRGGREVTVVLAGPFRSEADAQAGAARLREMGFANVRLR